MSLKEPDYTDADVAATALDDPSTNAAALYKITQLHPGFRAKVAGHPALYPDLMKWLTDLHDPDVDAALAGAPAQGMPPMAWPQYGYPMAGMPYGYRPRRDKKKAIIAAVVAGALLLGGGTALATTQHWFGGGGGGGGGGSGSSSGLSVTGDAPNASAPKPSFADGYRTIYQSDINVTVLAATDDVVAIIHPDQIGGSTFAVNRATGQQVWALPDQHCDGPVAEHFLVCLGETDFYMPKSLHWVDISTGQTEGDLDLQSVGPYLYDFYTFGNGVMVFSGKQPYPLNSRHQGIPASVGYFTGPGQPQWVTQVADYGNSDGGPAVLDEGDGLLFISPRIGGTFAFDEKTGARVDLGDYHGGGQIFPPRTICPSYWSNAHFESHKVNVVGGDPVLVDLCGGVGNEWMVPFSGPHPDIMLATGPNGTTAKKATGTLAMFTSLWSSPDPTSYEAWPVINAAAWDGADTVYALSPAAPLGSQVWAFSLATGKVIWRAGYPQGSKPGDVLSSKLTLVGGVLAIDDPARTAIFFLNTANGEPVADLNAMNFVRSFTAGDVLSGYDLDSAGIVIEPVFSQGHSSSMQAPADMPSCPAGMSPVSWTKFDTGSILVCKGDKYQVIVNDSAHPRLVPVKLEFTPSGMTITGKDGTVYRCGAGGSVVIVDAKGKSTTHPASMAWTPGKGQVTYQAPPSDIQPCPAGTWPISLSTWNGGWLLICGVDDKTPTWLGFSDGTTSATATTVTITTTGAYCADTNIGRVCANSAPALVTVTSPNGDVTQYPVTNNFFPTVGAGGDKQGTGAYGVPPPDATAADEARYLEQILLASAQTRADLVVVLGHLNNKQCSASDMATLQSVVASRQQQIDAVNGAPVTHLPNGAALVAKLSQALQVSLQADKLYVQWGQAVQAQDWSTAGNLASQWQPPAHQSDVLKQEFVDMWNAQIAPTYGVSTFRAEQI